MTKRHPSSDLAKALRARGYVVHTQWQEKGPKNTGIAWQEAYYVSVPGKRGLIIIVQTYTVGGWTVFVPPGATLPDDMTDYVARYADNIQD